MEFFFSLAPEAISVNFIFTKYLERKNQRENKMKKRKKKLRTENARFLYNT